MADKNIYIEQANLLVAKEFHYHADGKNHPEQEDLGEDVLENIIFSKLFDSNQKLLLLRKEIAASIDLGAATPLYTDSIGLDRSKIDPLMKNEWFFILAALKDANVLRSKPVLDREFVQQMVRFFPMLPNLNFETTEEYDKGMRKFAQSISVERRKWKINGNVVRLVDLQAKQHRLPQLSEEKIARIIRIAMPLYVNLTKLIQELRK
jgi:hypothetical protein